MLPVVAAVEGTSISERRAKIDVLLARARLDWSSSAEGMPARSYR